MIGGIIVTHGPIAQAQIQAAETILGRVEKLYGFSTKNLSLDAICQKIDEIISSNNWPKDTIIFVSLKGGSCWNASVMMKNLHPNIEVISGVNLPMILSFLTKRNDLQLKDLTTSVKDDGIRGININ